MRQPEIRLRLHRAFSVRDAESERIQGSKEKIGNNVEHFGSNPELWSIGFRGYLDYQAIPDLFPFEMDGLLAFSKASLPFAIPSPIVAPETCRAILGQCIR